MATTHPSEAPFVPLPTVEVDTIPRTFFSGLERYGKHPAMLFKDASGWQSLSAQDVATRVDRIAAELHHLGVRPGDRIALLSENRPEWAMADFAVLGLGAADVPLYATLPADQIAYILNDSAVCAIFVSTRAQLAKILEVRDRAPTLRTIIAFDDPGGADAIALSDLERRGAERIEAGLFPGLRSMVASVGPDDLATLIYTSGTTGDPKGVMLSHFNIASNIAASRQHDVLRVSPGMVALSFLPISHSYERVLDYFYWGSGVTIAYVDAVDKMADAMAEVRPHVLAAAPRVFEKIYARVMSATGPRARLIAWAKKVGEASIDARLKGVQSGPVGLSQKIADRLVFAKLRARTGGRVQAFASGSAPLSAEIARFFWAAGLPVLEGYGLTESSPILTANRPGAVRLGSVGQPIPGTEIRISHEGEILARGPQIMKGYFGKPDETAEAVDAEGWLHTGDVGHLDDDGFLWITDRIKNIIVTAGGKNVAPAPIENAAALSPFVSQVVMIGDRRRFPALLVVPEYAHTSSRAREIGVTDGGLEALARDPRVHEMIERDVLARLTGFASYERPKKVLLIPREFTVESGEITPTLKVKRRIVERNYQDAIERMYAES
jgi:long-chain acyl-CoA synthetase